MCNMMHSHCDEKSLIKGACVFKQANNVFISK